MRFLSVFVAFLALAAVGCDFRKEVWIYTSLPKEVIAELIDPLEVAVPEADIKWFQSGSEKLEDRVSSEMESGDLKADLVLTSDPLWYLSMKRQGKLLAYDSPAVKDLPAAFRDPDGAFAAVRLPVVVMGYNSSILKPADIPERWKDLVAPRFDRKISMANPFESAASFVAVSFLSKLYGWEFFAGLRKLGLVAEGSPSSVLLRIETGERPLGILPLETLLRAARTKPVIKPIYPLDGAIPAPGLVGILNDTDHPQVARKIYDWFFSATAQNAIARGGAYSPLLKGPSPDGARPWADLQAQLLRWAPESLSELLGQRDRIRAKFSEVVFH